MTAGGVHFVLLMWHIPTDHEHDLKQLLQLLVYETSKRTLGPQPNVLEHCKHQSEGRVPCRLGSAEAMRVLEAAKQQGQTLHCRTKCGMEHAVLQS